MAKISQQQYDEMVRRGASPLEIETLARQRGDSLPSSKGIITKIAGAKQDFTEGFVKGVIGDVVRPTTQMLQGLGQRGLAAVTPQSLEEVRATTGFKSLDDKTIEGQSVVDALKTQGATETSGRVAANIASFFVPTAPVSAVAGRTLSATGRTLTRAGIGLSSKEAPLVQAYKARASVPQRIAAALSGKDLNKPITNAETANRYNIFGTESMVGIKAKRAATNIWDNMISPVLKNSKEKVNMSSFIDDLQKQIDEVPELTRKGELTQALKSFADDYGKVGDVSMEKLQQFKEGWAKFLPDKVYKGKPIASAFREVQDLAADLARNKLYKLFPDDTGKVAYFDYGNMRNLQELGQKAMTGSKLKGGTGGFVSGLYDKVITPVATAGGVTLYRVGEGLQFVGRSGARVLGDLFK